MNNLLLSFSVLLVLVSHQCHGIKRDQLLLKATFVDDNVEKETEMSTPRRPVQPHSNGLKENDKIERLPGQPSDGVDFNQYSGYVTVDSKAGRAFFYYFVEHSMKDGYSSTSKPLVLWFSAGLACSSVGAGAFTEIGPFRVNEDRKTLHLNQYAWNREANILFVELAVDIGFSYSNTSSDYKRYGNSMAAQDTYNFLVNWFEKFPEYKDTDVFLVGESYSGEIAIQFGQLILKKSKYADQTKINFKGIALGNAFFDVESGFGGAVDYSWTHALISDEIYHGIKSNCDKSARVFSKKCHKYLDQWLNNVGAINPSDIYSPLCNSTPGSDPYVDEGPCSTVYLLDYFRNPAVQIALHANVADTPYPWKHCNHEVVKYWNDYPRTVLPMIRQLMEEGIQVWIYSGDVSFYNSVTTAIYAINKLELPVITPWHPWYHQNEVGGFVVEYKNLIFATVRGGGQFVSASQPARALVLFSSFVNQKLPPSTK